MSSISTLLFDRKNVYNKELVIVPKSIKIQKAEETLRNNLEATRYENSKKEKEEDEFYKRVRATARLLEENGRKKEEAEREAE